MMIVLGLFEEMVNAMGLRNGESERKERREYQRETPLQRIPASEPVHRNFVHLL